MADAFVWGEGFDCNFPNTHELVLVLKFMRVFAVVTVIAATEYVASVNTNALKPLWQMISIPEHERRVEVLEDKLSGKFPEGILITWTCSSMDCAVLSKRTTSSGVRTI